MTGITYERGAVDYLTLLETERTLNNSLDSEVSSRSDRLKASIDLFKAIGGNFEDKDCGQLSKDEK